MKTFFILKSAMTENLTDPRQQMSLARVLLVDDEPAARLTLQTVLEASGYAVDTASSAKEAIDKLDGQEYELVLTDRHLESPESGLKVLAHARVVDYRPATALITNSLRDTSEFPPDPVLVEPENLPELLDQVADLISYRAQRKVERALLHAS